MKTNLTSALRAATFAATFALLPTFASASDSVAADRAAQQLAVSGSVPVKNAGPYVETGTFRVQVATTLGRPGTAMVDGTWLYPNREIKDSEVRGTLVVRFDAHGRVSDLSLVTPAVATAMTAPKKTPGAILVANRQ